MLYNIKYCYNKVQTMDGSTFFKLKFADVYIHYNMSMYTFEVLCVYIHVRQRPLKQRRRRTTHAALALTVRWLN